jgi:tetratricopeptide (TPR) repeat protein
MTKKEYIDKIATLLAQRNWQGAINLASAAIANFSDAFSLYSLQAYAYLCTFDNNKAEKSYRLAIEKGAKDFETYCNYGVTLNRLKKYAPALDIFSKALAVRKGDMGARLGLISALRGVGSPVEAREELRRLVLEFPDQPAPLNARGEFYRSESEYPRALVDFTQAIALKGDVAEYYINRGDVRLRLADVNGAEEDFQEAIKLEAGNPVAQFFLGYSLLLSEKYKEALPCFDRALEHTPNYYRALVFRGLTKTKLGDYSGALGDCGTALELDAKKRYGYLATAIALAESGNVAEAGKAIENSPVKDEPDCQNLLKGLAEKPFAWDIKIFESLANGQ